jgi:hypothetical protein
MKEKLNKHDARIVTLEMEVETLRKFRHDTNGYIHNLNGETKAIKENQIGVRDELILIRSDIKEWMSKTNGLLNWQLSIKFMLVGGLAVGGVLVAGILGAAKIYMDYFAK